MFRSKSAARHEAWQNAVAGLEQRMEALRDRINRLAAEAQERRDADKGEAKVLYAELTEQLAKQRDQSSAASAFHIEARQADQAAFTAKFDQLRVELFSKVHESMGQEPRAEVLESRADKVDRRLDGLAELFPVKELEQQRVFCELREWIAERLAEITERVSSKADQRIVDARIKELWDGFLANSLRHHEQVTDQFGQVARTTDARADQLEAQLATVQRIISSKADCSELEHCTQEVQILANARKTFDTMMKDVSIMMDDLRTTMNSKADIEAVDRQLSHLQDEIWNRPPVSVVTEQLEAAMQGVCTQLGLKADVEFVDNKMRSLTEDVIHLREQSAKASDLRQHVYHSQMLQHELQTKIKGAQDELGVTQKKGEAIEAHVRDVQEKLLSAVVSPRKRRPVTPLKTYMSGSYKVADSRPPSPPMKTRYFSGENAGKPP